jgi:hypothetical protein
LDFRISGLPAEPFLPFFAMTDAELLARGARRHVATAADAPLMPPCRVPLRDARPGEASILLRWEHHAAPASPYRASGPIFVREGAAGAASFVNNVPEQQRIRLLSVRAYDADGFMLDAEVAPGAELEALVERLFRREEAAYLHAHNARRGCYSCRVDRAKAAPRASARRRAAR